MIEDDLKNLCMYVKSYEKYSGYENSPIQRLYKREYEDLIMTLCDHELIANTENIKTLREFCSID
jgi:hypothetical protein